MYEKGVGVGGGDKQAKNNNTAIKQENEEKYRKQKTDGCLLIASKLNEGLAVSASLNWGKFSRRQDMSFIAAWSIPFLKILYLSESLFPYCSVECTVPISSRCFQKQNLI